jgi:hypothetical protein
LHHDTLSQVAALSSEADQQVDGDGDPERHRAGVIRVIAVKSMLRLVR